MGTRTSSLIRESSPCGRASSSVATAELSANSRTGHSTPSARHSASSIRKMYSLKNCCSFSLAKLIRNCSRLLRAKLSKPKMSSSPG